MPLTMRPTGGHSPAYVDRQDWTIFDDGKPVGRIYEDASASTPVAEGTFSAEGVLPGGGQVFTPT
jgi:hypothetical protein